MPAKLEPAGTSAPISGQPITSPTLSPLMSVAPYCSPSCLQRHLPSCWLQTHHTLAKEWEVSQATPSHLAWITPHTHVLGKTKEAGGAGICGGAPLARHFHHHGD